VDTPEVNPYVIAFMTTNLHTADIALDLKPGERVEVRSLAEILATLDQQGRLSALSFMPEMQRFCGRRFRVSRRADKACDRVRKSGNRRMVNAVHLEDLRCDGADHDGCGAACLIFWKEAWLKRVDHPDLVAAPNEDQGKRPAGVDAEGLRRAARVSPGDGTPESVVWSCQATTMYDATSAFSKWDVWQFVRDVRSGHVKVRTVAWWAVTKALNRIRLLPKMWRLVETVRGPFRVPFIGGTLSKTPRELLNLVPGEWVEVKSYEEILATLDKKGKNRGMTFDSEMVKYCGTRLRVRQRVERIIDEPTGRMMVLPNDCIILEGATCTGDYHGFCPRAIYPYWREIWLRRVEPAPAPRA
jgi:hypothetical protein